jgi:hypothetical protein
MLASVHRHFARALQRAKATAGLARRREDREGRGFFNHKLLKFKLGSMFPLGLKAQGSTEKHKKTSSPSRLRGFA